MYPSYAASTASSEIVGLDPASILSGLLFIPYLIWGVYLLRLRLSEHTEVKPAVELGTLAALLPFYVFEVKLLDAWLQNTPWQLMIGIMALILSGIALYGHIVLSLVSHFLLDMMMPGAPRNLSEPRFGAAESCERNGDYEGAIKEYLTVSRMFPKDHHSALRAADNLLKLDRHQEAAIHMERGFNLMDSPDKSLGVALRLADIYQRKLSRPRAARRIFQEYMDRFPDSERAGMILCRIEKLDEAEKDEPA